MHIAIEKRSQKGIEKIKKMVLGVGLEPTREQAQWILAIHLWQLIIAIHRHTGLGDPSIFSIILPFFYTYLIVFFVVISFFLSFFPLLNHLGISLFHFLKYGPSFSNCFTKRACLILVINPS